MSTNTQLKTELQTNIENPSAKKLKNKILETHTSEIILGLCGPIGTDIHFTAERISSLIKDIFNYDAIIIRLSDLIKSKTPQIDFNSIVDKFEYYTSLIDSGNKLRDEHSNDILAQLAINEIAIKREQLKGQEKAFKSKRVCFIIDSIKRPEELELFRLIYRDIFYSFGVFSPLQVRELTLEKKGLLKSNIYQLIDRDSGEELNFGQRVSNTFIQADFFLRLNKSTSQTIDNKILRFLNTIFKTEIITPTNNETAMYFASAAAGNSACMSRQVGASITDQDGALLSVGWNDVPKNGGSVYKFDETDRLGEKDYRCMNLEGGKCFNDDEKKIIREGLANTLISHNLVKEEDKEKLIDCLLNSRIKELIEFSRAVHAEMLAIIHAGHKSTDSLIGGKLFCTTYPCHNCARHIVAAGISEIYYIEPYRKSLATKLHQDSITEDELDSNKVKIMLFEGVSPRRYLEFFKMSATGRKSKGLKIPEVKKKSDPKNNISLQAIPILEKEVTKTLREIDLI